MGTLSKVWLLILTLSLFATVAHARARDVLIVMSGSQQIYENAHLEITQQLATVEPDTLTYRSLFLDNPSPSPLARPDFVVSVGSRALEYVLEHYSQVPQLHTFITESSYKRNQQQAPSTDEPVPRSVIFLDQPLERQINLALAIKPNATVGMLLSKSAEGWMNQWLSDQMYLDGAIEVVYVDNEDDVVSQARSLLAEVDVLLAVPDDLIWRPTSARWLLFLAYQQRKPVIGFSAALTRAGAVASVYSESRQIGKQTSEIIKKWLSGQPNWQQAASPKYFRYAVNETIAQSLRIDSAILESLQAEGGQ